MRKLFHAFVLFSLVSFAHVHAIKSRIFLINDTKADASVVLPKVTVKPGEEKKEIFSMIRNLTPELRKLKQVEETVKIKWGDGTINVDITLKSAFLHTKADYVVSVSESIEDKIKATSKEVLKFGKIYKDLIITISEK